MNLTTIDTSKSFEQALRRLGWFNSHARQVLVCRYMLRQISSFDPDEYLLLAGREHQLLSMFRLAISVFSGINLERRIYSAPYEPSDRPETHYLKRYRSFPVFDLSCASGKPEFTFHNGPNGSFGFEHSTEEVFEDQLFTHEVFEVGKSVSLHNKSIADDRANQLLNRPLWRGFTNTEQTVCISAIETFERDQPGVWSFWQDWYLGLVTGHPIDRELQRSVAQVEDEVWKAGPDAVAEAIKLIVLRHKSSVAPGLKRNQTDTAFEIESEEELAPDILDYARSRVSSSLENALDAAGANGLCEDSYETIVIRRALNENPQSASLLATGFYDACLSF